MKIEVPKDHPRYLSLQMRERLFEGYETKVVAGAGLIAHGRGEAFDYLIGERTEDFARAATRAAAAAFLCAEHPVISVNGNVAALCPSELVELSRVSGAPLEVNLFYRTEEREHAIERVLKATGAARVLGVGKDATATVPELGSERRRVDPRGIGRADLVFVPLEDGDRTEALAAMGKRVVTVDLNPLSRTAQRASITIVDNIVRVLPELSRQIEELKNRSLAERKRIVEEFDNQKNLGTCLSHIATRLQSLGEREAPRGGR